MGIKYTYIYTICVYIFVYILQWVSNIHIYTICVYICMSLAMGI